MPDPSDAPDPRNPRPPAGWAVAAVAAVVEGHDRPLLVGPAASSLRDALGAAGAVVLDAVPAPDDLAALARQTDAQAVVLDDVLSWVPDERAYLGDLRNALPADLPLVVTVPNVTWLPGRVRLLEGRSPFGSGPVGARPLRFFARGTLVEALHGGGYGSVSVRAVRQAADPDTTLDRALVDRLRELADADVCGFVAVAASGTAAAQVAAMVGSGSPVEPEAVAALTASLRLEEEARADSVSEAESVRARSARELGRLTAERDEALAARDAAEQELARVRARRGYRALLKLEGAARRIPIARRVGRRILGRADAAGAGPSDP